MRKVKIVLDLAKASRTTRPKAVNSPRCRDCSCYDAQRVWCPILGSVRLADAGMCDYGRRKRASEFTMNTPSFRSKRNLHTPSVPVGEEKTGIGRRAESAANFKPLKERKNHA